MIDSFAREFLSNSVILLTRYFILCGLFFCIFYILFKNKLAKHKLQGKHPEKRDLGRDISYSISSSLIFALTFSLLITVFLPYTQIYENVDEFGLAYYFFSFFLMLFVHDTYFYCTHRLIHNKTFFKTIHLVHHKATNPSPWTAYAFHPIEALIQALILPVMALLFPIQKFALIIYFLFQFLHNIYGHLGYELIPKALRETGIAKIVNTSILHNRHHSNFNGNYGLYFIFWDRLLGTLKK